MKTARLLAAVGLVLAGCGGGAVQPPARAATTSAPQPIAGASCPANVAHTLAAIAQRIYGQAAHGRNVISARHRLARSRRLAAAVAAGDPAATKAALAPLLEHQIRAITITRGTHVLASVGGLSPNTRRAIVGGQTPRVAATARGSRLQAAASAQTSRAPTPTLAPVRGLLRDGRGRPVGRYVLSVAQDGAIVRITQALVGGRVEVRDGRGGVLAASGARPAAGTTVTSFPARAYPSGALTIALHLPPTAPADCGATASATVAATVGAVGERLARTEAQGPTVRRVLRHVATDARFERAVADDDPVALRAAIIRFFRTRSLHVVRIRATTADGRLVGDVGGPFVLCPASRVVRDAHGLAVGTVTLSVQDDTGYIKLMRRFTGAAVVLRTPTGTVPGSTFTPGPPAIPPRGTVAWAGRTFDTYTFTTGAFPSGPLQVALLL
jgi:hypothetical protein